MVLIMKGISQIISVFFLLILIVVASSIIYTLIIRPRIEMFSKDDRFIIRYVAPYNSSHVICYVVKGRIEGLVYRNGTWIYGEAFEGDLVVVPRILVEVGNR